MSPDLLLFLRPVFLTAALLFGSPSAAPSGGPAADPASAIEGYRSYAEMTARLRHFAEEHPDRVRLESVGKTLEGRDIWVLEIALRDGVPVAERPGLLLVGGLDARQAVGSELALEVAHYLVENIGSDDAVRARFAESVVYVFPRLNPDGMEHLFGSVQTGAAVNSRPYDDDNDGRIDEDAPDDLNADGLITLMRVMDPKGPYRADPDEPRLMRKASAAKGETGGWSVYWEGTDDDGDGFYNEDAKGGVNLNRNFQHAYPYYEREAGPHMISELETRALMDWVIAHRNVAMMLVYGEHDNLVTAPNQRGEWGAATGIDQFAFADASFADAMSVGVFAQPRTMFFRGRFGGQAAQSTGGRPSSGRRPATTVNPDDLEYFTTVSRQYRELTGIESTPATAKPAGALFEYGYFQFGVPAFSTPGWAPVSAEADSTTETTEDRAGPGAASRRGGMARGGAPGASANGGASTGVDGQLLKWMDAEGIDGFVPWQAYDHPTLGSVEIGGFRPYEAWNPPFRVISEITEKQGAFVMYLTSLFARVRIAEAEVTDHGGGVFRITAEVENAGFLPTALAHGVVSRSVRPTMVQLGIPPEDLLSGDDKTSFFQATDGSGGRRSFEWIIRGRRGTDVELRVVSQKGGSDSRRLRLQ